MQVEWHKFENELPDTWRECWVWGSNTKADTPFVVDRIDSSGWGWISELDCALVLARDNPTHWAYMERPEPPEAD